LLEIRAAEFHQLLELVFPEALGLLLLVPFPGDQIQGQKPE
jgi:hypothetical protein